jgi:hypothetical protein
LRAPSGSRTLAGMRVLLAALLVTALAWAAGPAAAQPGARGETARELATVMLQDAIRQGIDEQVALGMAQAVAANLEERLGRRLLEIEWNLLGGIVQRFVREALTEDIMADLAAAIYLRHFDAEELRQLLDFQRSAVGRKAARLGPTMMVETAQAVARELRASPAFPRMLDELRRVFPVLAPESP